MTPQEERDAAEEDILAVLVGMWLSTVRKVRDVLAAQSGTWSADVASAGWVPGTVQSIWDEQASELTASLVALGLTSEEADQVSARTRETGVSWVEAAVLAVLAAAALHGWTVTVTLRVVQDVAFGRATAHTRMVELPPGVPSSVDTTLVLTARDLATQTSAVAALSKGLALGATTKTWRSMHDARVRPDHVATDRTTLPLDEPFSVGGWSMQYPGDSSAGAPPDQTFNCFPEGVLVSGQVEGATKRHYWGPLITVDTHEGRTLTGTPNHPVLTTRGWVALELIDEHDKLLAYTWEYDPSGGHHVDDRPVAIEKVFQSLSESQSPARFSGGRLDFHGDSGSSEDSEVYVVGPDRSLRIDRKTQADQYITQLLLPDTDLREGALSTDGPVGELFDSGLTSSSGEVCGGGACLPFVERTSGLLEAVRLGYASTLDTVADEEGTDSASTQTTSLGEALLGLPGQVSVDPVRRVRRIEAWIGHVYNLSTRTGAYSANSLIVHNCRCVLEVQ